jgi:sialate O-acetylesterase
MKKTGLIYLLLAMFCASANAETARFASVITDNMVLQQKSNVVLWGFSLPGQRVRLKLSWDKKPYTTTANEAGKWAINVKTPKADLLNHTIALSDSQGVIKTLRNIVFGEVWLCSGQSNMETILMNQPDYNLFVENSEEEIRNADYPLIRQIKVERKESFYAVSDISTFGWKECTPENAKWFSAVAFFFAKKMYNTLKVPIGIILSSYGGSPVQSWIPYKMMVGKSIYGKVLETRDIDLASTGLPDEEYLNEMCLWIKAAENDSVPKSEPHDITLNLPMLMEKSPVGNQMGEFSLKREIEVRKREIGTDLHINLGTIDDLGRVFFNGQLVWQELHNSKSYRKVSVSIPPCMVKEGKNKIEVRVINILWSGGLTGPSSEMYYTFGNGGEKTSLSGEWVYSKIFDLRNAAEMPSEGLPLFSTASSLYNGMIYPVQKFTIKGILWYQGEANISESSYYAQMLNDMVTSWRDSIGEKLPFYFVQIAPYKYDSKDNTEAAYLREAQGRAEKNIEKSGMIVTMDLGDSLNIHPGRKKEVGERLALRALECTYYLQVRSMFPEVMKAIQKGSQIKLTLKSIYGGIHVNGENSDLEISEDGMRFLPGKTVIARNKILVSNPEIRSPKYVRYCWRDYAKGTIFNSEGLPMTSFNLRTIK